MCFLADILGAGPVKTPCSMHVLLGMIDMWPWQKTRCPGTSWMNIRGVIYLDVKIIGSQDELKESSLINLYKESALEVDSYWEKSPDLLKFIRLMGSSANKVKTKRPPTLRKSASQVEMSSVLFSLFSSSSGGGGSSCRNIHSQKNSENASLSHLVVRGPGDDLLQNVGIHIRQGDNFLVLVL